MQHVAGSLALFRWINFREGQFLYFCACDLAQIAQSKSEAAGLAGEGLTAAADARGLLSLARAAGALDRALRRAP